jgi:RimJ/RimL family protein N-acetyltransferase
MTGIGHVTLPAGTFELRPPHVAEAEHAMAMLRDPDVRQWNPGPDEITLDVVRDWLVRSADWSSGEFAVWSVHDAQRYVGNALICRIDPDQREAWVAYRTAPWARGRGAATSAVQAMTSFAFEVLGLERLRLPHAVANAASCRVADKAGYVYEGTERGGYRDPAGVRWDSHVHARLRDGVVSRS